MSVMSPDGKILIPGSGGKWWSPFGDTEEEIRENMRAGHMPNAPSATHAGPRHFTGNKQGDDALHDHLGRIGALGGQAKKDYEEKKR